MKASPLMRMCALAALVTLTVAITAADAKPSKMTHEVAEQSETSSSRRQLVAQAGAFSVLAGSCSTTNGGSCVRSDHWGWLLYWNNQRCTIQVNYNVDLTVTSFNTEPCCDKLQIGSSYYSGSSGPAGVAMSAGSVMYWRTDHSVKRRGWEICGEARLPPHPTGVANAFSVSSGSCHTNSDGSCFYSPSYPSNYGNSQTCSITVNANTELDPQAFNTESGYDWLTVNGARYQGTNAPTGVYVSAGSTISWRTDGSVTRTGFAICSGHPATPSPTTLQPTSTPTTLHPTSMHPTTIAPTTMHPTSMHPTTMSPTVSPTPSPTASPTMHPTSMHPTSMHPTTMSPTTVSPTTVSPTGSPTTESPTVSPTRSPTASPTMHPTTIHPTTMHPTTMSPTTSPTTESPTTGSPTTVSPTTLSPTSSPTRSPTTRAPTTSPTTQSPTTAAPTTASPTTIAPTDAPTGSPTTGSPTTKSPTRSPTTKSPTGSPTPEPTASPTNHWLQVGLENNHFEMNATLHNMVHHQSTSSVGALPSLFLFACVVGLAVTAMVTLRRRRAAASDRPDRERMPLVSETPTGAPTTQATDAFYYQDY